MRTRSQQLREVARYLHATALDTGDLDECGDDFPTAFRCRACCRACILILDVPQLPVTPLPRACPHNDCLPFWELV